MRLRLARFYRFPLLALAAALIALPAPAQTSKTFAFGSGLGTLTYIASSSRHLCSSDSGLNAVYTLWSFGGFTYNPVQGSSQSTTDDTTFISGSPGTGTCPPGGPDQNVAINGNGYAIVITPVSGAVRATITASGYINPKYVVVSVIYAPLVHKATWITPTARSSAAPRRSSIHSRRASRRASP